MAPQYNGEQKFKAFESEMFVDPDQEFDFSTSRTLSLRFPYCTVHAHGTYSNVEEHYKAVFAIVKHRYILP